MDDPRRGPVFTADHGLPASPLSHLIGPTTTPYLHGRGGNREAGAQRDARGGLLLAGVVFGVNLLPAFGPPTWAVLVFFRLQSNLAAIPLVLIGALAAACGRLVLAHGSRRFRSRLSPKRIENLEAVRNAIAGGPKRAVAGLALFALSPVPSAQLFVAAGLVDASLVPLTAVFFAGRIISSPSTPPPHPRPRTAWAPSWRARSRPRSG